jgi:hypothetical protein
LSPSPSPLSFALLITAALLSGCAARSAEPHVRPMAVLAPEEAARFADLAARMREVLLLRDVVAPPTIAMRPQTRSQGLLRVTATPVLAEEQPWNQWPDGTARLFNDGVGFLVHVRVEGPAGVRWVPSATRLAVNALDDVYEAAGSPEELFEPIVRAAAIETLFGGADDFARRVDAAGPFVEAYLSRSAAQDRDGLDGIVVFPAPAGQLHAVALQLTLGVEGPDGAQAFTFVME